MIGWYALTKPMNLSCRRAGHDTCHKLPLQDDIENQHWYRSNNNTGKQYRIIRDVLALEIDKSQWQGSIYRALYEE